MGSVGRAVRRARRDDAEGKRNVGIARDYSGGEQAACPNSISQFATLYSHERVMRTDATNYIEQPTKDSQKKKKGVGIETNQKNITHHASVSLRRLLLLKASLTRLITINHRQPTLLYRSLRHVARNDLRRDE